MSNVRRGLLQRPPARNCFGIRGTMGGVRWDRETYMTYLGQPGMWTRVERGGCGHGSGAGSANAHAAPGQPRHTLPLVIVHMWHTVVLVHMHAALSDSSTDHPYGSPQLWPKHMHRQQSRGGDCAHAGVEGAACRLLRCASGSRGGRSRAGQRAR